jgi:hypothetical protein
MKVAAQFKKLRDCCTCEHCNPLCPFYPEFVEGPAFDSIVV